ncbi:MAG: guanylate kinase [Lentisphaeria bacterium]|nr:guanylate kinase [Lentisphaeria bacterium]
MTTPRYGMILIISGPSGSGKSTLCSRMFEEFSGLEFSVSCTTRAPRGEEKDGIDYHFLSREEFEKHIRNNDFIEYAEVHGNYYGTLKSEVFDRVEKGIDVVLDIDVQGALQIKKKFGSDPEWLRSLESIFIAPPSYTELEKRLRGRGTDAEASILKRLANSKQEMTCWNEYKYIIVNDDLATAQKALSGIISTLRLRSARFKEAPFHEK